MTDDVVPAVIDELVPEPLVGLRLDRFVSLVADVSRAVAATLIAEGGVSVDGEVASTRSLRLAEGDRVSFTPPAPVDRRAGSDTSVEFDVVYVDDDVVVVNKPAGLVVHPGAGSPTHTLANGLVARFPEMAEVGDPERPGIVHRLDKGTSGLLVAARTEEARLALTAQLVDRSMTRRYDALVSGRLAERRGVIDAPIGRSRRDPTRMAVLADGRGARTHYQVTSMWFDPEVSLVSCTLETGRTHQIRVHLRAIGHGVAGDGRYGGRKLAGLDRPFLHAADLGFVHPRTEELLSFSAPLPEDLTAVLNRLGPEDEAG